MKMSSKTSDLSPNSGDSRDRSDVLNGVKLWVFCDVSCPNQLRETQPKVPKQEGKAGRLTYAYLSARFSSASCRST